MRLLLAIFLVLLLQQGEKVPEAVKKAQAKLATDPADLEANTTVGKYLLGLEQYDAALDLLAKGSDATFRALALKDSGKPDDVAALAAEWMDAAKKNAQLRQSMTNRAMYWFGQAWLKADPKEKAKLRAMFYKIAAPPAGYEKPDKKAELAVGYEMGEGIGSYLESGFSHSGKRSLKLLPIKGKDRVYANSYLNTLIPGKKYTCSCWVYSDKTDLDGNIDVFVFDNKGQAGAVKGAGITFPSDSPFWQKVSFEMEMPENAGRFEFRLYTRASVGAVWIDDVSLVLDGKDFMKNGGFEDKK